MSERAAFGEAKPLNEIPIIEAVKYHWRSLVRIIALSLVNAIGFHLLWVYAISHLTERMHVSTADALDINTLTLLIMMSVVTIAAITSDRIGCKPVLYFVASRTLFPTRRLWWLMQHQDFTMILAGQLGFAILIGAAYAGLSATMARILPTGVWGP